MIKVLTIVGARPQIIKAAALSRTVRNNYADQIEEKILHTGQHYDNNMSDVFFSELGIPLPDYQLNAGSGTHGEQTAKMISGIENILLNEYFDALIVYGDTNSTLAGALAASKLHIPVIHIEAGLRSYKKSMPEEINRIACDHVSTLLFSPTQTGIENLKKEGFAINNRPPFHIDNPGLFCSGDIMYDNSIYFSGIAEKNTDILEKHHLSTGNYILATIHRDNNTDNHERLQNIFASFLEITEKYKCPIIIPLHPRTAKILREKENSDILFKKVTECELIKIIPPASFFEIIVLEKNALLVMTDSGGVQKEAYYFKRPCIILRNETEWIEILDHHAGILADADKTAIIDAFEKMKTCDSAFPPVFGNAHAAEFIVNKIIEIFNSNKRITFAKN